MALVCLCYLTVTITMASGYSGDVDVTLLGTLAGAVICNCLWVSLGQYSIELYPTVVRTTASSVFTVGDSLIGVIVPQLIYLGMCDMNLFLVLSLSRKIYILKCNFIISKARS